MDFGTQLQVASTFACNPLEPLLERAAVDAGVAGQVAFLQFTQLSEYMLAADSNTAESIGVLVMLRLEDWVREKLESATYDSTRDVWLRQEFRQRLEEFVSQLGILASSRKQVWFLACPSNGWIAEQHKLGGLCRTFTNLLVARVRNLSRVTLLNWPAALPAEGIVNRESDRLRLNPFTEDGFGRLAEWSTHQLAQTFTRQDDTPAQDTGKSPELAAYLEGLRVQVQLAPAGSAERHQVDHLLRTVASFSLTGEKPAITEAEVDAVLAADGCMLVSVTDRISSYGHSGLVAFRVAEDTLTVDTMSLSCTVLGKQVEFAVLSALGGIAAGRVCTRIVFEYRPSGRNQPMLAFLQQVAERESDAHYAIPTGDVDARIQKAAVHPGAWTVKR